MDECSAVRIGVFRALVDDFTINMMSKYLAILKRGHAGAHTGAKTAMTRTSMTTALGRNTLYSISTRLFVRC